MGANSEFLNPSHKQMARGGENPFLHFEIIINILNRLPVKSILRFRSVCKDWKNLFRTQHFIAEHARHSARGGPFLLLQEYGYTGELLETVEVLEEPSNDCFNGGSCDVVFFVKGRGPRDEHLYLRLLNQKLETVEILNSPSNDCFNSGWRIAGSCNGLLCVANYLPDYLLCLWNPVTREVREIPQRRNDCLCPYSFGFGFSSIVNDYKIVRFYHGRKTVEDPNSDVCVVKVYSLSTDSWKELEPGAVQNIGIWFGMVSVCVDGTIAWLGHDGSLHVLVSFDIATEVFTLTPIPSVVRAPPTTLGVYQNKFVIVGRRHKRSHFMDIWVMEQVVSESGKHFSCSEKYSVYVPYDVALGIFCIWGNDIVCCDKEDLSGLKLFNLTTKEWKESPKISSAQECCAGVSYGGSLVSLFNPQGR